MISVYKNFLHNISNFDAMVIENFNSQKDGRLNFVYK